MLKADLHLHCSADPKDNISYSDKELIDHLAKLGFNVASITCHDLQHYNEEIASYAKKKGILLIPGMEKTIKGKHVLFYNFKKEELDKIKDFADIPKYKRDDNLVACPHPFLPHKASMMWKFVKLQSVFDAVEYCHFYTRTTNHNLITRIFAKNKPFIGNSDAHFLEQIGTTYSTINSKPEITKILDAVKRGDVTANSRPLGHFEILKRTFKIMKLSAKSKK
ncbi:PHP domain-containing protein [Candidatus Woesearchaeota archaeon]|nr:PHP domain-containing protein [Candidatus Woesearchaeota archaeon]